MEWPSQEREQWGLKTFCFRARRFSSFSIISEQRSSPSATEMGKKGPSCPEDAMLHLLHLLHRYNIILLCLGNLRGFEAFHRHKPTSGFALTAAPLSYFPRTPPQTCRQGMMFNTPYHRLDWLYSKIFLAVLHLPENPFFWNSPECRDLWWRRGEGSGAALRVHFETGACIDFTVRKMLFMIPGVRGRCWNSWLWIHQSFMVSTRLKSLNSLVWKALSIFMLV